MNVAGKDRTGVLTALLLSIVGHSAVEIADDYVLTRIGVETQRVELTKVMVMWLGEDAMAQAGVFELSSTSTAVMIGFLQFVEEKYGGFEGYCKNTLGLGKVDLEKIKENISA
jgi:protein tyrosine/serine phosphatase